MPVLTTEQAELRIVKQVRDQLFERREELIAAGYLAARYRNIELADGEWTVLANEAIDRRSLNNIPLSTMTVQATPDHTETTLEQMIPPRRRIRAIAEAISATTVTQERDGVGFLGGATWGQIGRAFTTNPLGFIGALFQGLFQGLRAWWNGEGSAGFGRAMEQALRPLIAPAVASSMSADLDQRLQSVAGLSRNQRNEIVQTFNDEVRVEAGLTRLIPAPTPRSAADAQTAIRGGIRSRILNSFGLRDGASGVERNPAAPAAATSRLAMLEAAAGGLNNTQLGEMVSTLTSSLYDIATGPDSNPQTVPEIQTLRNNIRRNLPVFLTDQHLRTLVANNLIVEYIQRRPLIPEGVRTDFIRIANGENTSAGLSVAGARAGAALTSLGQGFGLLNERGEISPGVIEGVTTAFVQSEIMQGLGLRMNDAGEIVAIVPAANQPPTQISQLAQLGGLPGNPPAFSSAQLRVLVNTLGTTLQHIVTHPNDPNLQTPDQISSYIQQALANNLEDIGLGHLDPQNLYNITHVMANQMTGRVLEATRGHDARIAFERSQRVDNIACLTPLIRRRINAQFATPEGHTMLNLLALNARERPFNSANLAGVLADTFANIAVDGVNPAEQAINLTNGRPITILEQRILEALARERNAEAIGIPRASIGEVAQGIAQALANHGTQPTGQHQMVVNTIHSNLDQYISPSAIPTEATALLTAAGTNLETVRRNIETELVALVERDQGNALANPATRRPVILAAMQRALGASLPGNNPIILQSIPPGLVPSIQVGGSLSIDRTRAREFFAGFLADMAMGTQQSRPSITALLQQGVASVNVTLPIGGSVTVPAGVINTGIEAGERAIHGLNAIGNAAADVWEVIGPRWMR